MDQPMDIKFMLGPVGSQNFIPIFCTKNVLLGGHRSDSWAFMCICMLGLPQFAQVPIRNEPGLHPISFMILYLKSSPLQSSLPSNHIKSRLVLWFFFSFSF